MIDYSVVKKLKDAGFPQGKDGTRYLAPPQNLIFYERSCEWIYDPTLSELIEACGGNDSDNHFYLWFENGLWEAELQNEKVIYGNGISPEESVANLWLTLNKK